MRINNQHPSSFRDPSGYIYTEEGIVKRIINPIYFEQYKALKKSGFYKTLFENELLISHKELSTSEDKIIIQPEYIPFITYPYEWSFSMYKEAALLTLKLQKHALNNDFSLKDASAFNVTFYKGKAIFIDTLSFEFYKENSPWRAYKQFITHFFGPLVLSHYYGASILKSMINHMDGIPIETISELLPFKTKLSPTIYSNIHLLAKMESKYKSNTTDYAKTAQLSKKGQLKIIENLYEHIRQLELNETTEWGDYYNKMNYSDTAFEEKKLSIKKWVEAYSFKRVVDFGGNDGAFVKTINAKIDSAIVNDIDSVAVDRNYLDIKKNKLQHIIPMVVDILNPSPAIGFHNKERFSFIDRVKYFEPDVIFALALIHHISLSGNVPFERSAQLFSTLSKYVIIEFPKREDSWVTKLLNDKREFKGHFDFYNLHNFKKAYKKHFIIVEELMIKDSKRVLFLMERYDN